MENIEKTKNVIEALLIVAEGGLSSEDLKRAITDSELKDIEEGIKLLKEEYTRSNRSFNIAEIAGKYCIVTRPEFMPWIGNLYEKEWDRLTGPSLETLAILAYKQPATRAEVESIRGVNVGGVLKTLLDKDLIRIRGRKDVIGRPLLYRTTDKFLEIFGLNSLEDLPILRDFKEEDLEFGKPQEMVEVEEGEGLSPAPAPQAPEEGREEDAAPVDVPEKAPNKPDEASEADQANEANEEERQDVKEQEEERQDVEEQEDEIPEAERVGTQEQEPESIGEARREAEMREAGSSTGDEGQAPNDDLKETDNEAEKTE